MKHATFSCTPTFQRSFTCINLQCRKDFHEKFIEHNGANVTATFSNNVISIRSDNIVRTSIVTEAVQWKEDTKNLCLGVSWWNCNNYSITFTIDNILTYIENDTVEILHLEFESHLQFKSPLTKSFEASHQNVASLCAILIVYLVEIHFKRIVDNGLC